MGSSLTNCVNLLKRVVVSEGTFPNNRDHNQIRQLLHRCKDPLSVERWHRNNTLWVSREAGSLELDTLCERVGTSLLLAAKKANVLRNWAERKLDLPSEISPRTVLYLALRYVIDAFQSFDIVAKNSEKMGARHIMDMVRIYLGEVYDLAVILGSLADPNGWFQYWAELRRNTKLEGFLFDSADFYQQSLVDDRTIKGVLLHQNQVPATCLPVHPTPPVLGHGTGPYSNPIVRNSLWTKGDTL